MKTKICKTPCPKCGSLDIYRQFHYKDDCWNRPMDFANEDKAAESSQMVLVDAYQYKAKSDLIRNNCRICRYVWFISV